MKYGRLLIGACVVVAALWVIIGEQITGVSLDAVVNARLSTLRGPVAGTLEMPMRPLGDKFAAEEPVAKLSAAHQDNNRLDDLELEAALLETELSYRRWITRRAPIQSPPKSISQTTCFPSSARKGLITNWT